MDKHIRLPKDVYVGENALEKLSKYEEKDTVVVSGPRTRKVAGEKAAEVLETDLLIVEEATREEVDSLKSKIDKGTLSIAVGGGKVIDVTKSASYELGNSFVSVPTTCSNDGVASQMASLVNGGTRESISTQPPIGVVVDFSTISKCPYKLIRGGIGDTLSNYVAVRDWQLGNTVKGEYYGDYSSKLSLMVAEIVRKRVKDIREMNPKGLGTLMEALISSGASMGIAGSSRPASGSAHKFSHALDKLANKPALHGEQCGVGTIVMSYLQGEDWKEIKNTLETGRCPTTAKEINIDSETAVEAMIKAKEIKPNRYTIIEHIDLNREIAENALRTTGIVD